MSSVISSATLAAVRQQVQAVLRDSCQIQRQSAPTQTSDGYQSEGGYATVHTVLATMRAPTSAQLQEYAAKIGNVQAFIVRFAYGTDVLENDKLILNSVTLRVQGLLQPGTYATLTSVIATRFV